MTTLVLDALPAELQLCILHKLSTRSLLIHVTRLSKYWFALVCELVRQRAVHVLERPGASITFETSNPSDYRTRTMYTLQPPASGLFEPTPECVSSIRLPRLSLAFAPASPTFDFSLDEDEYFGLLLWSVWLSTQRSIQCRVSPPASPRLVAFDRAVKHDQKVVEGLDRLKRSEFVVGGKKERELVGECGPSVYLRARLNAGPVLRGSVGRVVSVSAEKSAFRVGFESVGVDAASVVVASEDGSRGNEMTVLFCGR